MNDYRKGESSEEYPEIIRDNRDAQAFYGVAADVLSEVKEPKKFLAQICSQFWR